MASRAILAAVAAVLVLTATACGGGTSSEANQPPVLTLDGCVTSKQATLSHYEDSDVTALVGVMGKGSAGVVISYEIAGTVCPYLPLAERLVADGYRVLLYDRVDGPEYAFIPPMVKMLRDQGVAQVALVGGSVGGMGSVVEGAKMQPPVAAVVSLSGASQDTIAAAGGLRAPLLQVVAAHDQPFAGAARSTNGAATHAKPHRLVVVEGTAHASLLFSVDRSLLGRVVDFLEHAMPL